MGGILFSLPVFLMGLFALPGGVLADRIGSRRLVGIAALLAGGAGIARALAPNATALFGVTWIVGMAIGLAQPGLPRMVRELYADNAGRATAIYASGFPLGGLLSASLTIPLFLPAAGSWRGVLVLWSMPLLGIGLVWLLWRWPNVPARHHHLDGRAFPWRHWFPWSMATVFMLQSLLYYMAVSWLPTYYHGLGWSLQHAALPLTIMNVASVIGGFAAPLLSDRLCSRRWPLRTGCLAALTGITGFWLSPLSGTLVWAALLGAGVTAIFAVSLAVGTEATAPHQTGLFNGLTLTVGYIGAMIGPWLGGFLRDLSGGFGLSLEVGCVVGVLLVAIGLTLPETYGGRSPLL